MGHAVHVVQGHGYVLYFCGRIFCGLFTRQWTTTMKLTNLFQIVIASLIPRFSPCTNENRFSVLQVTESWGCSSPLFAMKVRSSTVSWISVSISTILWFSHCNDAMVVIETLCDTNIQEVHTTNRSQGFVRLLYFLHLIFFVQVHSLHCEVDFQCGNRVSTL